VLAEERHGGARTRVYYQSENGVVGLLTAPALPVFYLRAPHLEGQLSIKHIALGVPSYHFLVTRLWPKHDVKGRNMPPSIVLPLNVSGINYPSESSIRPFSR